MAKFKAIIFDFNGVLFFDSHHHEKAWKTYSKVVRGSEISEKELNEFIHGRTNKDILEYLTGQEIHLKNLARHTENKEAIYRKLCLEAVESCKLSPGAIELLDYLKENNIPRTIATAAEINNLKFFWDTFKLKKWFCFELIAYDDGKMKGKPAPDIYLKAAKNLNLKPSECMVIEDAKSGIEAARNAGIGEIIAMGPKATHTTLIKLIGVDKTITDFYELLDYVRSENDEG